jgi:hypothetical protein
VVRDLGAAAEDRRELQGGLDEGEVLRAEREGLLAVERPLRGAQGRAEIRRARVDADAEHLSREARGGGRDGEHPRGHRAGAPAVAALREPAAVHRGDGGRRGREEVRAGGHCGVGRGVDRRARGELREPAPRRRGFGHPRRGAAKGLGGVLRVEAERDEAAPREGVPGPEFDGDAGRGDGAGGVALRVPHLRLGLAEHRGDPRGRAAGGVLQRARELRGVAAAARHDVVAGGAGEVGGRGTRNRQRGLRREHALERALDAGDGREATERAVARPQGLARGAQELDVLRALEGAERDGLGRAVAAGPRAPLGGEGAVAQPPSSRERVGGAGDGLGEARRLRATLRHRASLGVSQREVHGEPRAVVHDGPVEPQRRSPRRGDGPRAGADLAEGVRRGAGPRGEPEELRGRHDPGGVTAHPERELSAGEGRRRGAEPPIGVGQRGARVEGRTRHTDARRGERGRGATREGGDADHGHERAGRDDPLAPQALR